MIYPQQVHRPSKGLRGCAHGLHDDDQQPVPQRRILEVLILIYIWCLDPLRFIAALMVAVFHLSWLQSGSSLSFPAGWVGVEIFFVISGMVIMQSAEHSSPVSFLERRVARLYPAAIVCAIINVIVLRMLGHFALDEQLEVTWTLGSLLRSVLLLKGPFVVGSLWTIPVELAFYAGIFVAIVTGKIAQPITLAVLLIVWSSLYVVPFFLSSFGIIDTHVPSLAYGKANMTLLRHGAFFGVGMIIYEYYKAGSKKIIWLSLVLGLIPCFMEIAARARELSTYYAAPMDTRFLAVAALSFFGMAILLIILCRAFNPSSVLKRRNKYWLRVIGLATYPIYLMHEAVAGTLFGVLRQAGVAQSIALISGLLLVILVGVVVALLIEPRVRALLVGFIHPVLVRLTQIEALHHLLGSFPVPLAAQSGEPIADRHHPEVAPENWTGS